MIDIHCHLLYGVDDGAQTMEESVSMLETAAQQGIHGIILTPHYRHGMFSYPTEEILAHYEQLLPIAKKMGIRLGLGCEYHVNSRIVEYLGNGRCRTLAGSDYVLCEYSHGSEFADIYHMTEELIRNGYLPVIAHVERYLCMTEELGRVEELRNLGAWIQMNADAILGYDGRKIKRYCKKMIRNGYVDIVASDSHGESRRACHMRECCDYVGRKYGMSVAKRLFSENPQKIIGQN